MSGFLGFLLCVAAVASAQGPRPVIRYANMLGGSGEESSVFATTDAAGNVYLTGTTTSPDFPATVRISNSTNVLGASLFVVKVDPSGAHLLFSTIIGGAVPGAIALDSNGSVYVAGVDAAVGYPATVGAYSATGNCFVSKLDPTGASLVYSTRLACNTVAGLAVDSSGSAYLTGSSNNILVTTPGAYRTTGFGAFALKLNSAGSGLVYSTYLPGTDSTSSVGPRSIVVDALGSAYIAGSASIQSFQPMPDVLPHEEPSGDGPMTADAMVLKLAPDGSAIAFASLFGGTGDDVVSAIALGADGSIYVSGASQASTGFGPSLAFPTTPGAADTVPGFPKGFVARLTPGGDAFLFSTFLSASNGAPCLSVADAGVDVLATFLQREYTPNIAGTRIMRISPDGTTLVNSSTASSGYIGCGQGGANFVALGSTLASPNLSHIGSNANVSFSLIAADVPGAPQFEVNAGELNPIGWRAPDGTFPPVRQVVHATADGQVVVVGTAVSGLANAVTVDQPVTTTPADITVIANQGSYNGELILFAPGTKDGLVMARLNMASASIFFTLSPSTLQFTAESAASPLTPVTVHVSTGVVSDVFGTVLPVPLNYSVDSASSTNSNSPSLALPSWLRVANTGLTPADATFTADPAGLADGLKSTLVRFTGAGPGPPAGLPNFFPAPLGFLNTSLRIGPAPVTRTPATITLIPSTFTLRFTDASQQQQSATVHLATTSDSVTFKVSQLTTWLTASPSTGQTPADITLTATLPGGNGAYTAGLGIDVNGVGSGYVVVNIDVALPGYVGGLSVEPIANSFPPVSRGIAPGSLFYIQLDRPELIPDETDPAAAAVLSLAGYSFAANGTPVALIAYQAGRFLAQMPADAKPGSVAIDGFDSSGARVASANAMVTGVSPDFVADPLKPRAQKADGTTIDATNPVAPGDAVLVHVTGLGRVNPLLATGQTAAADTPSTPVAAVTATIGGKNAQVVSAQASRSLAGVADIWLTTPDLYDGDHYISLGAMGAFTSTRIPIKVKNP
jgi:uncharacterized protein (TIGR03437 family)